MIILRPSIFLPSIQETADAQCLHTQWVKKLSGELFLTGNVPLRNLPNAKISLTIYTYPSKQLGPMCALMF